ncbi:DUF2474 domain-containing protein [Paraburkholderia sartisoli]|uniref:DUF2474 domain-containing protein n=1 Tax=Paraburkholderia sartisoli TaxID=83784 RepID=A0A1H4CL58_9BURK|nr:DUF2474 domain-containing protein [Paraburkholderia sartisoli]SEA61074.1 Protein of unknown function [Paraburkholderia sartisoli]
MNSEEALPVWKRLAWLGGIWLASVLALGLVVEIIRLGMSAAGLKTH